MLLIVLILKPRADTNSDAAWRLRMEALRWLKCGHRDSFANPMGVTHMDNNTLLFQDKGSGRFKDVKIYPNRIEVLKKGTLGGKHTEIVYLKDITGVNRIKGRDVFLRNRLLTACVFSLSSRAKAQEFVNALNMVM